MNIEKQERNSYQKLLTLSEIEQLALEKIKNIKKNRSIPSKIKHVLGSVETALDLFRELKTWYELKISKLQQPSEKALVTARTLRTAKVVIGLADFKQPEIKSFSYELEMSYQQLCLSVLKHQLRESEVFDADLAQESLSVLEEFGTDVSQYKRIIHDYTSIQEKLMEVYRILKEILQLTPETIHQLKIATDYWKEINLATLPKWSEKRQTACINMALEVHDFLKNGIIREAELATISESASLVEWLELIHQKRNGLAYLKQINPKCSDYELEQLYKQRLGLKTQAEETAQRIEQEYAGLLLGTNLTKRWINATLLLQQIQQLTESKAIRYVELKSIYERYLDIQKNVEEVINSIEKTWKLEDDHLLSYSVFELIENRMIQTQLFELMERNTQIRSSKLMCKTSFSAEEQLKSSLNQMYQKTVQSLLVGTEQSAFDAALIPYYALLRTDLQQLLNRNYEAESSINKKVVTYEQVNRLLNQISEIQIELQKQLESQAVHELDGMEQKLSAFWAQVRACYPIPFSQQQHEHNLLEEQWLHIQKKLDERRALVAFTGNFRLRIKGNTSERVYYFFTNPVVILGRGNANEAEVQQQKVGLPWKSISRNHAEIHAQTLLCKDLDSSFGCFTDGKNDPVAAFTLADNKEFNLSKRLTFLVNLNEQSLQIALKSITYNADDEVIGYATRKQFFEEWTRKQFVIFRKHGTIYIDKSKGGLVVTENFDELNSISISYETSGFIRVNGKLLTKTSATQPINYEVTVEPL